MIEQHVDLHQAGDQFPWVKEAWRHLGAHERPGLESDPQIKQWADAFELTGFNEDVAPYCSLYIRYCFYKALPDEPLPNHPLWSWGWLRFGVICEPQLGCVLVFYRGDIAKQIGHVAFYLSEEADDFIVLGANQSDAVSVKRMPKARMLASRWPRTWPLPG